MILFAPGFGSGGGIVPAIAVFSSVVPVSVKTIACLGSALIGGPKLSLPSTAPTSRPLGRPTILMISVPPVSTSSAGRTSHASGLPEITVTCAPEPPLATT